MIRILLIEDSPDDNELVVRAVKAKGLDARVEVAQDGQRAVEILGIDDTPVEVELPDVIVLDLKLPKISGQGVLERIRSNEKTSGLPVLVLSSSDQPIDVQGAERHAAKFLRKPDDYYEFLTQVGDALAQLVA
jgi:two-component system response regulator